MAPQVLDFSATGDPRDAVHRAVQALVEGKLVALPTETVYTVAASALVPEAVERLMVLRGGLSPGPPKLALRSTDEVYDYVPQLPPVGKRLARRCWPGPMTLQLPDAHPESVVQRLPAAVRQVVIPEREIRLRVPGHELMLNVLRLVAGPLVICGAHQPGESEAVTAAEVVRQVGPQVDLILDDGPCKFGQPSSLVRVDDKGFQILRPGVFSEVNLKRLASLMIILVCTGNTCRSPMGEVLLKQHLARRLGCSLSELEDRGVVVLSAGTAAATGMRAAPEAIAAMRERGLDLSQHESQPLSDRLVRFADVILTMTRGHRQTILEQWPEAEGRVHLISGGRGEVSDPIGGPLELYRQCADQLDAYLSQWAQQLPLEGVA